VAPIYLGKQKGFFSSRGIDLNLTAAQGGAAVIPGVVSDQFQFGFSNATPLMIAASKNLPLKITNAGDSSTGKDGPTATRIALTTLPSPSLAIWLTSGTRRNTVVACSPQRRAPRRRLSMYQFRRKTLLQVVWPEP
jgi:hypothetical protein